MNLLLHTCCAPCSSAIIEALLNEGIRPTIFYFNPNIFPEEEYLRRKEECSRYAAECGLDMIDADYLHDVWVSEVAAGLENEPERGARCLLCFKHRLLTAAQYAMAHGFDTLTTTLASSRWKSLEQINAAGEWAVEQVMDQQLRLIKLEKSLAEGCTVSEGYNPQVTQERKLIWWDRNWRKGGLQQRRNEIIKEKGFYNQLYCGCEFSIR